MVIYSPREEVKKSTQTRTPHQILEPFVVDGVLAEPLGVVQALRREGI